MTEPADRAQPLPGPMRYDELIERARRHVPELMPWDLAERLRGADAPLVLDVREAAEVELLRIAGSLHVPRGVLEQACEWDYDETEPALAAGRGRPIVVVCRSGRRSLLAAERLLELGFAAVWSLRTGLKGWNDAELPLVCGTGSALDADQADARLASRLRPEQRAPRER